MKPAPTREKTICMKLSFSCDKHYITVVFSAHCMFIELVVTYLHTAMNIQTNTLISVICVKLCP